MKFAFKKWFLSDLHVKFSYGPGPTEWAWAKHKGQAERVWKHRRSCRDITEGATTGGRVSRVAGKAKSVPVLELRCRRKETTAGHFSIIISKFVAGPVLHSHYFAGETGVWETAPAISAAAGRNTTQYYAKLCRSERQSSPWPDTDAGRIS